MDRDFLSIIFTLNIVSGPVFKLHTIKTKPKSHKLIENYHAFCKSIFPLIQLKNYCWMSVSLYLNILFLVEHTLSKGWSKVPISNSLYITTLYRKWEVQDQHAWTGPPKSMVKTVKSPLPSSPVPFRVYVYFFYIYTFIIIPKYSYVSLSILTIVALLSYLSHLYQGQLHPLN